MEGDELSEFLVTKRPKTYSKLNAKRADTDEGTKRDVEETITAKREPLTTKNAVKLLLEGTLKLKVCRYCLNVDSPLYEMDQVFQFGGQSILYKVTIRDMVASFHPFKVIEDPNFPTKICGKCLDNAIQSYLFTQQCERASRALRNCFEDMYEKFEKLDPLERTKKRGRQKLNPNYNTLYAEHENVINYADPIINIVNKGSELIENSDKNKITDLECPKCWQTFTNIESLFNHEKIHPKYMWFSCRICGKSFPKRHQYRKHVKTNHDLSKELIVPDTGFRCQECGVNNETYDQHLQHIEKHKFHMVMEHLVERKMDKLCTVCLSKEVDLVELDKTVNLHGGCPELTGQRNLYNILGSTMPEHNSHKYQELLIPQQANILKYTKKQKPSEKRNVLLIVHDKFYFSLSEPIIVSREIFETDDYLFFFAKPIDIQQIMSIQTNELEVHKGNEIIHENISDNVEMAIEYIVKPSNTNIIKVVNDLPLNDIDIPLMDKVTFTFSKPEYVDDIENFPKSTSKWNNLQVGDVKDSQDTVADYKNINWIFEECEKKIDNDKVVASTNVTKGTITEECQFCWMFKNTPKCDICKMPTQIDILDMTSTENTTEINEQNNEVSITNYDLMKTDTKNNIEDCESCWIFKKLDKCNNCKKSNSSGGVENNIKACTENIETLLNKRKNDTHDNNPEVKRFKWQCKICLTSNGNTEKCHCCDFEFYDDVDKKPIKVNLGVNNTFLEDENKGVPTNESKVNCDVTKEFAEHMSMINNKCDCTSQNEEVDTKDIHKIYSENLINSNTKEDIVMDTESENSIEQKLLEINNKNVFQEEMDVEEFNDTPSIATESPNQIKYIPTQIPLSMQLPMVPTTLFNFHMGSGTQEEREKTTRRFKRPLRRVATTQNKY